VPPYPAKVPIGVGVTAATWALFLATFVACFVEAVEATTIIMAMGFTRSWRSTWLGVATALVALAVVTAIFGYALTSWLPEAALQLVIGGLLLVFGLQWLRKAILRASHRKSMHDEDKIFQEQQEAARLAGDRVGDFDMFSFMVSLKGTFLEGMEVVFIVITFGLNAHRVPVAVVGALAAVIVVAVLAFSLRRPLAMIPENSMKYGVGLMLASFGTFWVIEGLGVFRAGQQSVSWPGSDAAILVLLVVWFLVTRAFIAVLRRPALDAPPTPVPAERSGG
jgi:Ca2+/H+ antiporter, TMEM165/GDT1 family